MGQASIAKPDLSVLVCCALIFTNLKDVCRIPVAVNSSIRVVLHFLELMPKSLGERVFNVEINGHMVARELDVMSTANATGAPAPVVVSFDTVITARDKGLLAVELVPVTGAAFLSALEVLQH